MPTEGQTRNFRPQLIDGRVVADIYPYPVQEYKNGEWVDIEQLEEGDPE